MRIQDAIDGLGPEGKLRKPWWEEGLYCTVDGNCLQFHFPVQPAHSPQVPISIVEYLYKSSRDDDWQVIPEERIAVGDAVRKKAPVFPAISTEAKVIGIEKMEQLACIQWPDGSMQIRNICDLTLTHKGSKSHVFEGVEFCQTTPPKGLPHVAMIDKGGACYKNDSMKEVRDNGKTYRMTLEEME